MHQKNEQMDQVNEKPAYGSLMHTQNAQKPAKKPGRNAGTEERVNVDSRMQNTLGQMKRDAQPSERSSRNRTNVDGNVCKSLTN